MITIQHGRKIMSDNDDINFPGARTGTANTSRYKELVDSAWSPFVGYRYWNVFIFSMSYAFAKKLVPKPVSGEQNMPASVFDSHTRNMMRALAIEHTGDLHIIKNSESYVKICEEYANAGFQELYKIISDNDIDKVKPEDLLLNLIKNIVVEQD
jgi:hypothetical protein